MSRHTRANFKLLIKYSCCLHGHHCLTTIVGVDNCNTDNMGTDNMGLNSRTKDKSMSRRKFSVAALSLESSEFDATAISRHVIRK